ncbi:MAG: hypothetical protein ABSG16_20270 [Candidatus Acidiferrum sp.]
MATSGVGIRYRPAWLGWCVREGNWNDLRIAFRYSHAFWGGVLNPIIVVDDPDRAAQPPLSVPPPLEPTRRATDIPPGHHVGLSDGKFLDGQACPPVIQVPPARGAALRRNFWEVKLPVTDQAAGDHIAWGVL